MTQQRDIERLLDQWFADGSSVAPDRVVDIVADRIERQPQRPAWRLDWRHLTMSPLAKAGAAIAAVVLSQSSATTFFLDDRTVSARPHHRRARR